ncbi:MAG: restriction endonuclease subunit S [Gammaproteobacteria bacterium]|nr:restriction endonuclease subunit S [Gammaproteobacteria bacterium]MDH5651614.1 restriction endonuclease subunit S [Gammaproteobacteria bacterium]
MSRQWDVLPLSRLIEIKHGHAFKSEGYTNAGDYVLLTPGNFREEGGFRWLNGKQKFYTGEIQGDFILHKGDLMVAMTEQSPGLLGSAIFIDADDRYLHNQRLGRVLIKDTGQLHKRYLYHLFNSADIRRAIAVSATGSKVKHTSPDKIGAVEVPVPPLSVQQQIAGILDTWDRAMTKTGRLIACKKKYLLRLSSILLFGQNMLRSGEKATRWYSVPDHWQIARIGMLAKEVKVTNRAGEELPVLSCTKYDGLVDSLQYFDKQIFSKDTTAYKVVKQDQFAYATNHIEEGSIGYQDLYPEGLVSPMYTVFETSQKINNGYLYKVLKTGLYRHIFEINTSASVDRRGSLRWNAFAHIPIPLPPLSEQEKINNTLELAQKEIRLLQKQVRQLRKQKRGLCRKLLAGDWRSGKHNESLT